MIWAPYKKLSESMPDMMNSFKSKEKIWDISSLEISHIFIVL